MADTPEKLLSRFTSMDDPILASERDDIILLSWIGKRIGYGRARQVLASLWDAEHPGIAKAHGENVIDPRVVEIVKKLREA